MKILTATLLVLVLLAPEAASHEQRPPERRMSHLISEARGRRALPGLVHGDRLHRFGRRQVERMIACRCVMHAQPPLFCETWGQAVGVGARVRAVFLAFMASPAHRRILLDPSFRRFAVGARRSGGLVWIAVELCR